jgi:hypothetical protein
MVVTTTAYRVDSLINNGAEWARSRGLANYQFSVYRVGDHAHIVNCSFDMVTLMAVVQEGSGGYQARITKTTRCEICQPTPGISVPLAVKVHGREGYDPAPEGADAVFDHCGDCRLIWPSDLVAYDAGPDDWFCPLCRD